MPLFLVNQEVREERATLMLAQQVSPCCTENNTSVNCEPEPLFVQIVNDPLALVALYQFLPARELILQLHQLQQKSIFCIAESLPFVE